MAKTWHQRIKDGEVKVCPACGSALDHETLKDFMIVGCSNEQCVWTDEKADFIDMKIRKAIEEA